jgi:DNA-binding NarL/FixJ family response regulator
MIWQEGAESVCRVLLSVKPQLFCDSIRRVIELQADDMEVVGEADDPIDLMLLVQETGADVLIQSWGDGGRMPAICSHLLSEYPDLRIVGVSQDENQVVSCRRVLALSTVTNPLPNDLLGVIRQATDDPKKIT